MKKAKHIQEYKVIHQNEWLSLHQTSKGFVYAQRKGINSIASLVFKKENNDFYFLIRKQLLPNLVLEEKPEDFLYPSCITGTIEEGDTPLETALRETFEEGGIYLENSHLRASGKYIATTQSNEVVYTFVFEKTSEVVQTEPQNDGSYFEQISKNEWVSLQKLEDILQNDLCHSSLYNAYLLFIDNVMHK